MSPNAGDGVGGACCGVSANEYSCAHGVQVNFRDLTLYLTYGKENWIQRGPLSSSFWVPRNHSNRMDRQARTGDTVIVKSREMTGKSQILPCADTHSHHKMPASFHSKYTQAQIYLKIVIIRLTFCDNYSLAWVPPSPTGDVRYTVNFCLVSINLV